MTPQDESSPASTRMKAPLPALDSVQRYVRRYGVPMSVYPDKHTTYKSSAKPTLTEQLQGRGPQSQVERALAELGVTVIHAHSPQAKGRVERRFKTFQDRLVKEMRLAGVHTLEQENRFLAGYLPRYNRRFTVVPTDPVDLHRPLPTGLDLKGVLCCKTERTVRNDATVVHSRTLYQLLNHRRVSRMTVEDRLDGTMRITHQGKPLRYRAIAARPRPVQTAATAPHVKAHTTPAPDHPWRRRVTRGGERRGRLSGGLGKAWPGDLPHPLGHPCRVSTGSAGPATPGHGA